MRVRIHPAFIIYLILLVFLDSYSVCVSILMSLFVHEAWHYVACRLVGEQIDQVILTPFGGVMTRKRGTISHKGLKGIFVHTAGPLGNYVFLLSTCLPILQRCVNPVLLRNLMISNASMLLFNILPVLPLDGGQVVFCLGYYFFPIGKLVCCLSFFGVVVGIGGLFLAFYGLMAHDLLNCSLLMTSLYLIGSAGLSRRHLFSENIYTIIQERLSQSSKAKKVEFYQVSADTALFELFTFLKEGVSVVFSFTLENQRLQLQEDFFCHALLADPFMSVKDAWLNSMQCREKIPKNP